MFYVTTIQSVKNGFATDTQGRNLSFIGYLNVKQGDNVYTDGTVIFGNVPPKGEPVILDEQVSGIPVLGSTIPPRHNEVRGYFTQQGKFKKYKIKADGWLVNDKKYFAHDDGEQNIIDAEFSEDGKLYTVEKVEKKLATDDETDDDYFYFSGTMYSNTTNPVYARGCVALGTDEASLMNILNAQRVNFNLVGEAVDYRFFDNKVIKTCELIIKKDSREIQKLNLSDLLIEYEQVTKSDIQVNILNREPINHLVSRASVENFKIHPDGSWDMLLAIETFASRTFKAMRKKASFQYRSGKIEWLNTHGCPFAGPFGSIYVGYHETYTVYFVDQCIEQDKKPDRYCSTFSLNYCLVKITSDNRREIIFEKKLSIPLILLDYRESYMELNDYPALLVPQGNTELQKRGYKIFDKNGDFRTTQDADSEDKLIRAYGTSGDNEYFSSFAQFVDPLTIPAVSTTPVTENPGGLKSGDFSDIIPYVAYKFVILEVHNSAYLQGAPVYNTNSTVNSVDEFDFPVQDDYYATLEQPNPNYINVKTWKLKAVFDENDEKIFNGEDILPDENDAHQWNMSLVKLKSGDFLFGIRKDAERDIDGKLFKIPKGGGEVEQVADGLKNFRLRELKNISKAKK